HLTPPGSVTGHRRLLPAKSAGQLIVGSQGQNRPCFVEYFFGLGHFQFTSCIACATYVNCSIVTLDMYMTPAINLHRTCHMEALGHAESFATRSRKGWLGRSQ